MKVLNGKLLIFIRDLSLWIIIKNYVWLNRNINPNLRESIWKIK